MLTSEVDLTTDRCPLELSLFRLLLCSRRSSETWRLPRYRKSCDTSHYTTRSYLKSNTCFEYRSMVSSIPIEKKLYTRTAAKKSRFASNKVFIRWWPWVQAWFRVRSIIAPNLGRPSSISLYYQTLLDSEWSVRMPYRFRCSHGFVLGLFLYIYSLFFAGESPSLVKNVQFEFEIKHRHSISRRNMSVDQPFLIHCSRRSLYFFNFRWCDQSMLASKGIVNSAMITSFEWTNQMMRSGRWRVVSLYQQ